MDGAIYAPMSAVDGSCIDYRDSNLGGNQTMRNSSFSHVGTPTKKYQPGIRGLKVANSPSMLTSEMARTDGVTRVDAIARSDVIARGNEAARSNSIARRKSRSPLQFTGCVSDLSYDCEDHRAYDQALKNYTEVYRISHSYIESAAAMVEHDYALSVTETEEHGLLGLVGDDIEQTMRSHVHFSDEEIEQCGYLGWLQH